MPGPITHYSFMFSPDDTPVATTQSGCDNSSICQYNAKVPESACASTTDFSVTVSAANQLGQGPPSQPKFFGMETIVVKNENVKYNHSVVNVIRIMHYKNKQGVINTI